MGGGDDPITADALYPRWANFFRPDDVIMTDTGTSSLGLAFAQLPNGARVSQPNPVGVDRMGDSGGVRRRDRRPGSSTGPDHRRRFAPDDRSGDQPVRSAWAAPDCLRAQQLRLSQRAHVVQGHAAGLQRHRSLELRRASARDGLPGMVHRASQHLRASSTRHSRRRAEPTAPAYIEVVTDAYEAPPLYKKLHENVESFYKVK